MFWALNKGCLFIYLDLLSFLSTVFYNFQSIRFSLLWLHLFLNILCFDAVVSGLVFLNFIVRLFIASIYMSKEILTPSFSPVVWSPFALGCGPEPTWIPAALPYVTRVWLQAYVPSRPWIPKGQHWVQCIGHAHLENDEWMNKWVNEWINQWMNKQTDTLIRAGCWILHVVTQLLPELWPRALQLSPSPSQEVFSLCPPPMLQGNGAMRDSFLAFSCRLWGEGSLEAELGEERGSWPSTWGLHQEPGRLQAAKKLKRPKCLSTDG